MEMTKIEYAAVEFEMDGYRKWVVVRADQVAKTIAEYESLGYELSDIDEAAPQAVRYLGYPEYEEAEE